MVTVGVLSPVTGGFYFGEVLAGIVRVVGEHGGRVTVVQTLDAGNTGDELVPEPDVDVAIGAGQLDGFIAIAQASSPPYLNRLRAAGLPVVLTSNAIDGFDGASVVADNHAGVRAAVDHLVAHGHTRIGFVGNLAQTDMRERFDAYEQGAASHGLTTAGCYVTTGGHIESDGALAVEEVLAVVAAQGLTALVTSTDRIALGLMAALGERGVRIPQDLAVVGFDDVEGGWHSDPPLASVNQRIEELGATSARLLLAEIAGAEVPHVRTSIPSTFVPRGSCGCAVGTGADATTGERDADRLVAALLEHLGLDATDPATGDLREPVLDELDAVILTALRDLYPEAPSPETFERFTLRLLTRLEAVTQARGAAGSGGAATLLHCMARVTVLFANKQAATGLERADRLSTSLVEQYDVGRGLLGRIGSDPSDLRWLDQVQVPLACLGLWAGAPAGALRIAGTYDPDGRVPQMPDKVTVEHFPPRALSDLALAADGQVTFVIPVRGESGDHGFLCLVGEVDTHFGTGRATYNHWASLLAVALKRQSLLEEIRRSEERYSLAASATHDGLWDWDVRSAECFYSERCQDLLGITAGRAVDPRTDRAGRQEAPELAPWLSTVHPDDRPALRAELWRMLKEQEPIEIEHRVAAQDGVYRWTLCRAVPVGEPGHLARRIVGSLTDIHPRKELEEQLRQGALYDAVTGLPNRRLFLERLTWAVEQSHRRQGSNFAVVFLDLDGFKLINDSLGHLMGDHLLRTIGERLRGDLRSVDTAARFGGDEFAVLLTDLKHEAVLSIVERIQDAIATPVALGDQMVAVSASVGITTSDTGYHDAEEVLRDADIAMYHAKETERGTASVFDPAMHLRATGRLQTQSELRTALLEEQFVVHYQPVVAMAGAPVTQFEALVRWEHPERGLLLPADFLGVLEETGMVVTLGQWILDRVCAQIADWRTDWDGELVVSVNLAHREFWAESLLLTVSGALTRYGVAPSSLVLEITESVIMADPEAAMQIMADLHATGVRLHMDDFGTGQSSLGALRSFPVDALKLDRSFVEQIDVDAQTTELVRVIVEMGRALGLEVVAEGVETTAQALHLQRLGCRTAQGWLYAQAVPGDQARALLGADLTPVAADPAP